MTLSSAPKNYKGTIVEESLEDNRILNNFPVSGVAITEDADPSSRWHIYAVSASETDIELLSRSLGKGGWYSHFWNKAGDMIIVYRGKKFVVPNGDKSALEEAKRYGRTLNIPEEQLDFKIE